MIPNADRHLAAFLGTSVQLGFVVPDMEAAIDFWTREMNVGPFVVIEESLGSREFFHRGKRSDVRMSIALSYQHDIQIEVITQRNTAPSPYMEFLAERPAGGLHHLGYCPEDYEKGRAEIVKHGFTEVCSINMKDGTKNATYYSGPGHLGLMLELVPVSGARATYFKGIRELVDTWDGSRPIRRYKTKDAYMASPDCRS